MSNFLNLNLKDLGRGFLVAVFGAVVSGLYTIVQTGGLPTLEQLQVIGLAGLGAGLAYLIKNLFTNNLDQVFRADPPK